MAVPKPLPPSSLRWTCPASWAHGAPGERFDRAFGQEDAADAIASAMSGSRPRLLFAAGADGPERMPIVRALVRRLAPRPAGPAPAPRGVRFTDADPAARVVLADDLTRAGLFGCARADDRGPVEVRRGALLRADGRVLVLEVDDLADDDLWPEVRRALRDRVVVLRPQTREGRTVGSLVLPAAPRAVLVGRESTYARLFDEDPVFSSIVPVKATLETTTRAAPRVARALVAFARTTCADEGLRPPSPSALRALLEESVRDAGRRGRLSLRTGRMSEWLREADLAAARRGSRRLDRADVLEARGVASRRLGVEERRVFDSVLEGIVLVDLSGAAVGQVNGLAVHDYGNLGKVARITATVGPGREGLVNVEREVALSGSSYDKGVHILAGWITQTFAHAHPTSLSARIVFEQSYGHLTGDSATCAEAVAIVSALARAPLRQELAITGSMDQHGRVQAIGGVNEKIEGFFDLCAAKGFPGRHGVVVPRSNVEDLMLRPDVVEAARRGRFRVHPIERIEEGIALLTGRDAKEVLAAAEARLAEFARVVDGVGAETPSPRRDRERNAFSAAAGPRARATTGGSRLRRRGRP